MTKFRVADDKEIDPIVYFRLVQDEENIKLMVINDTGSTMNSVLTITKDGFLHLNPKIRKSFGFTLDEEGRIEIVKDI